MPAKLTSARIHFGGPLRYRLRSLAELSQSILEASIRRAFKGPRRPGWNLFVEAATTMLKKRMATAFNLRDVNRARSYLDSISINSSALAEINIRQVVQEKVIGSWFNPKNADPSVTILYFHGGGYSFYPSAYTSFIAQIAVASKSRTFALDYRLAPEHRFPTQLEDALNAYRWLLDNGNDPNSLVVAGDSAGANLALSLLLAARDSNLPQPALAIALSPPTDFGLEIVGENEFDWIDLRALFAWRDWFCDSSQRHNPLISPLYADLRDFRLSISSAANARFSTKAFSNSPATRRIRVPISSSKVGET